MPNLLAEQSLILIIDDSVDMIHLLSGMLEHQGQILFATNGEDGIRLARQRQPQLILLDVEMPGMNGYEVCATLKNDPDTHDCAIIFVTAKTGMESEIAALEAGAVDFITKPFNPAVVRVRVQTHLKLQQHDAMMTRLASRDGLTGLYNRRYFDEALTGEFERHRRQKLPFSLALIDIDHFKAYNDSFGHLNGDDCLKSVAAAISNSTHRPGEIVARYGGEEFVTILPHTDHAAAQQYGELICARIRGLNITHPLSTAANNVTVSVGLACVVPHEGESTQLLIAAADRVLYQAKSAGRNRAIVTHLDLYQKKLCH